MMPKWGNPDAPKFYQGDKHASPWTQDLTWKKYCDRTEHSSEERCVPVYVRCDPPRLRVARPTRGPPLSRRPGPRRAFTKIDGTKGSGMLISPGMTQFLYEPAYDIARGRSFTRHACVCRAVRARAQPDDVKGGGREQGVSTHAARRECRSDARDASAGARPRAAPLPETSDGGAPVDGRIGPAADGGAACHGRVAPRDGCVAPRDGRVAPRDECLAAITTGHGVGVVARRRWVRAAACAAWGAAAMWCP